jgi:hypothetical protein
MIHTFKELSKLKTYFGFNGLHAAVKALAEHSFIKQKQVGTTFDF